MGEVINEVKGGCDGIRWMVGRKLIRVALLYMARPQELHISAEDCADSSNGRFSPSSDWVPSN